MKHEVDPHRITAVRTDITALDVGAIVNAANETLLGGGGVDGAIHRAAGPELLEACRTIPEVSPGVRCPTGDARITPGFRLTAGHVIHTVGPVWRGGGSGERDLLAGCYTSSLSLAVRHDISSIAFPAISCGVFGYPVEQAASVAVSEISRFLATDDFVEHVLLVAFDQGTFRALREALGDHT